MDSTGRRETPQHDMAMVALLLSIMGLLGCLPVGAAGLAMGYVARDRLRASGGSVDDEPMIRWAIVLGWAAITVSILALVTLGVLALVRSDM